MPAAQGRWGATGDPVSQRGQDGASRWMPDAAAIQVRRIYRHIRIRSECVNGTSTKRTAERALPLLRRLFVGLGCPFLALALAACAPTAPMPTVVEVPVRMPNCDLPNIQRGRAFIVEAWAVPDARFNVGEPFSLQARVSAPAYLNMFHVSTSCKVTRLLHNVHLQPTEIADFPRQNSRAIIVKPPAGEEAIYFVASREQMAFIAEADILQGGDGLASLDLSPGQFYQRLEQVLGRVNPDDLSVTTLRTSIVGN